MKKLSISLLCRIYLAAVLLITTALTPLPYSPLALVLFISLLFVAFRPRSPEVNSLTVLATIFLLPLLTSMSWQNRTSLPGLEVSALYSATALPVLYLLDGTLRQNAPHLPVTPGKEGVSVTPVPGAIFIATTIILLISLFTQNHTMVFTSLLVVLYLVAMLLWAIRRARLPLVIPLIEKRLIAHAASDIAISVGKTTSEKLFCRLTPIDNWIQMRQAYFTLAQDAVELSLTLTPPLSGPARPQFQSTVMDGRGLVQVNRRVEALELHVIPRARYAQWLATKYLEQAGTGVTMSISLTPVQPLLPRGGIEFLNSRDYYPGDPLRNIDWRHTLKLSRLITKEYSDVGGQSAIIVANLGVADADSADKLAFNLITTALTLARLGIPAALATYNSERIISTMAPSTPRETLIQAILISRQIVTESRVLYQSLQPADVHRLRRNISQLKQATSTPARRMLGVLNFEYQAVVQAAKKHPATLALTQVTRRVPPPAIIILVSPPNHDTEALAITLEKLARRGFTSVNIGDINP